MDPPARNCMWRFGYPNPVNYNDNELFCGGYAGSSTNRWNSSTLRKEEMRLVFVAVIAYKEIVMKLIKL